MNRITIFFLSFGVSLLIIFLVIQGKSIFFSNDPEADTSVEKTPIGDSVGSLLGEKKFVEARDSLDSEKDNISESEYDIQKNRIDTIESYANFYESDDSSVREQMISKALSTIDEHFIAIDSETSPDIDRSKRLLAGAFLDTETWSDKALLVHIAEKLNLDTGSLNTPVEEAAVFNELFTRSIDIIPNQEAYIKRAWFNSRLLLTDSFSEDLDFRKKILDSILSDVESSYARMGMRFTSRSSYYNSYIALAFADVLDFLYQEGEMDSYSEVDYAYKQALMTASGDYLGHSITEDIIRMNYAASVHRTEGGFVDNQNVVDILGPVAQNLRLYAGKSDLSYEGILVMLRNIPSAHNQNNASIFEILSTYKEFSDIPSLLNWTGKTESSEIIFKLI